MSLCGTGVDGKECAICICATCGCVAGKIDDYFLPATKEQLIERLETGKYLSYRDLMKKMLKAWYDYDYDEEHEEQQPLLFSTRLRLSEKINAYIKENHIMPDSFGVICALSSLRLLDTGACKKYLKKD